MPSSASPDQADALYHALKRYTAAVRRDRRLATPPARSLSMRSADGSSTLTLDLIEQGGVVQDIGYRVRACSLTQATTAILVQRATGITREQLQRVRGQLETLLRTGGGSCDWPELEILAPISDIPTRHDTVLLPFRALDALLAPQDESRAHSTHPLQGDHHGCA